jgi:hypothetical protein
MVEANEIGTSMALSKRFHEYHPLYHTDFETNCPGMKKKV